MVPLSSCNWMLGAWQLVTFTAGCTTPQSHDCNSLLFFLVFLLLRGKKKKCLFKWMDLHLWLPCSLNDCSIHLMTINFAEWLPQKGSKITSGHVGTSTYDHNDFRLDFQSQLRSQVGFPVPITCINLKKETAVSHTKLFLFLIVWNVRNTWCIETDWWK